MPGAMDGGASVTVLYGKLQESKGQLVEVKRPVSACESRPSSSRASTPTGGRSKVSTIPLTNTVTVVPPVRRTTSMQALPRTTRADGEGEAAARAAKTAKQKGVGKKAKGITSEQLTGGRAARQGQGGKHTPAWMQPKHDVVKPGLSQEIREMLNFDPDPVEAEAQLALRAPPMLMPVSKGKKPRKGKDGKGGEGGGEGGGDAAVAEKPRFSAMSLKGTRRTFKNKLRDEMASSVVRMCKIYSQQLYVAEERERRLEELVREMNDLLVLAGNQKTSPVVGVDAEVCERRASLAVQVAEIQASIKRVELDREELRKTLGEAEEDRLEYRVLLNKREAALERLQAEHNDLIKLRTQLEDLVKRTRAKFVARSHAFQYEQESRAYELQLRQNELELIREKRRMEQGLEAGLKQWDAELDDGVNVVAEVSLACRSKVLASQVESVLSFNVDDDPRVDSAKAARGGGQESAQAGLLAMPGTEPAARPRSQLKGLPRASRKQLSRSFLTILANARTAPGFKSRLNNPKFVMTMMHFAICKGTSDSVDAQLTTAPAFIEMLRDEEAYRRELDLKLASCELVKGVFESAVRRSQAAGRRLAYEDATERVEAVRDRLLAVADRLVPGAQTRLASATPTTLLTVVQSALQELERVSRRHKIATALVRGVLDACLASAPVSPAAEDAAEEQASSEPASEPEPTMEEVVDVVKPVDGTNDDTAPAPEESIQAPADECKTEQDTPASEGSTVEEGKSAAEDISAVEDTPASEGSTVEEGKSAAEEDKPSAEDTSAAMDTPATEDSPATEGSAVEEGLEEGKPSAEDTSAAEDTPASEGSTVEEGKSAAEEDKPSAEDTSAAEDTPAKEDSPATEGNIVEEGLEEDKPSAEDTSAAEDTPATEDSPATEGSTVEEGKPSADEPSAAEDSPATEGSTVEEGKPDGEQKAAAEEEKPAVETEENGEGEEKADATKEEKRSAEETAGNDEPAVAQAVADKPEDKPEEEGSACKGPRPTAEAPATEEQPGAELAGDGPESETEATETTSVEASAAQEERPETSTFAPGEADAAKTKADDKLATVDPSAPASEPEERPAAAVASESARGEERLKREDSFAGAFVEKIIDEVIAEGL